ncbi:hypothetical protein BLJAPNOD_05707 [Ensifer sp. M14]|nr:hypothetical protein BLJAPNOD_05707 [Ensifer sp. M14]
MQHLLRSRFRVRPIEFGSCMTMTTSAISDMVGLPQVGVSVRDGQMTDRLESIKGL